MSTMNPIINEMVNECYMQDWANRASQAQNYRQIKDQRLARNTIYCRFLTWLGGRLVIVGVRLLERYGKVSPVQNHRALIPGEN
jgi:hypothetical protein